MIDIDPERLLRDLHALRSFGAVGDGVVRTAFSPVDMEARDWLVGRMTDAGLAASIDGVGNVIGRTDGSTRALLLGSHTDTQPTGGWLDGALGVIYGLEIARAFGETGGSPDIGIDIASWMDEEGTHFSCLGSRSFCGEFTDDELAASESVQGESIGSLLRRAGLTDRPRSVLDRDRHLGYLEAHIEQGPFLEQSGHRIGVVTSIVGVRDFVLRFHGSQNHAGTTPMNLRRDAGMAAITVAHGLDAMLAASAREATVWTVGDIGFLPGAASIVPGEAHLHLQVRDGDEAFLDDVSRAVIAHVEEFDRTAAVDVELASLPDSVGAVDMDARIQEHCAAAAEALVPGGWMRMQSGAAHDAQILATKLASGMIFVPSIGGVSHDFQEDTSADDIVLGCQVMAAAVDAIVKDPAKQ